MIGLVRRLCGSDFVRQLGASPPLTVFVALISFDKDVFVVLHRQITVWRETLYTLFWICRAMMFAFYVFHRYSYRPVCDWTSGYILE